MLSWMMLLLSVLICECLYRFMYVRGFAFRLFVGLSLLLVVLSFVVVVVGVVCIAVAVVPFDARLMDECDRNNGSVIATMKRSS